MNVLFSINSGNRNTTLEEQLILYHDRVPKPLLPIANDAGGNLICISTSGPDQGCIYFWEHENEVEEGEEPTMENVWFVAPDFDTFLSHLYRLS